MVLKKMESSEPNAFASALELLDAYVKLLRSIKAERGQVDDLAKLASALRRLTPSQRAALFSSNTPGSDFKKQTVEWPLEKVAALTHAQVETFLGDKDITKAKLQLIASGRFGMSKGSLSALPREALLEKIRTLVQHEGTHESIARAASGGSSVPPADSSASAKGKENNLPDPPTEDATSKAGKMPD